MNIKRNIVFTLERKNKDGKPITENLPIRMRIMYASQRIDLSTGYRIDANKWNKDLQRVNKNCTNKLQQSASDINSHLDKLSSKLQDAFKEFEIQEILPTPTQLKDAFNGKLSKESKSLKEDMLLHLFDEFIQECGSQNNWSIGTIKKFTTLKNHLEKYDKNITFQSIDEDRLNAFASFLLDKQELRNTTIEKHIKNFKWFLRWAIKKRI